MWICISRTGKEEPERAGGGGGGARGKAGGGGVWGCMDYYARGA